MVQLAAGPWALPLMDALLAGNGSCRVQGMAFPVLRFTHTREAPHRLGQQPSQVEDLQMAVAQSRTSGVDRGWNSLELTLLSTPADSRGLANGARPHTSLLMHEEVRWGSVDASCQSFRHPYLRTEALLRTLPLEAETWAGDVPPQLQPATAQQGLIAIVQRYDPRHELPQCVQTQATPGLREWSGILYPGDGMVVAVATGGRLLIQGPGTFRRSAGHAAYLGSHLRPTCRWRQRTP